jgi:hypothetical protein
LKEGGIVEVWVHRCQSTKRGAILQHTYCDAIIKRSFDKCIILGGTMATPIFVNRKKFDAPQEDMKGRQILALAGFGDDHDLFLLKGEGDPTGGTPIGLDQDIKVKAGEHFRAIPGNRNFG